MPMRYYISRIVQNGGGVWEAKVLQYPTQETSAEIDPNARNWCLVRVKAADFTAIDADPQCTDILEGISDVANANTKQELADWLKSQRAGDYPVGQINRIKGRLNSVAVNTDTINDQTTLWEIIQRPYRVFNPSGRMEDM